jgi:O-methyltransferase
MLARLKRALRRIRWAPPSPAPLPLPTLSVTTAGRFLYYRRLFAIAAEYEGDVVECGVGKGQTLLMWAALAYDEAKHRQLWGFDSFEGFPLPTAEDASPRNWRQGEWAVSTPTSIRELFLTAGYSAEWFRAHVTLVKGFFADSLTRYTGERIALLHLDVDLYESYRDCLMQLYDKVTPGGVIAFDEYMGTFEYINAPGGRQAIDEFLSARGVSLQRDPVFGKYYARKPH